MTQYEGKLKYKGTYTLQVLNKTYLSIINSSDLWSCVQTS